MSTNPSPTQTIQTLYAAFGRGNIPAILALLSDDVDWRLNVDQAAPGAKRVPDFRPFRGRADVGEFFAIIGRELEFHGFEPLSFLSNGNEVAVRLVMDLSVRKSGARVRLESIHYWVLDDNGRVTRFIEYLDTLAAAAAWDCIQERG